MLLTWLPPATMEESSPKCSQKPFGLSTVPLESWICSLVIIDIKTRRLAGFKKDIFGELLHTAGIPEQYFCNWSLAIWDVLLPMKKQATKLVERCITTKFFQLQLEYLGMCRISVTVCNVPVNLTGEVAEDTPRALKPSIPVPKETAPTSSLVTKNKTSTPPSPVIQKTSSSPLPQAMHKTPPPALKDIAPPDLKRLRPPKKSPWI